MEIAAVLFARAPACTARCKPLRRERSTGEYNAQGRLVPPVRTTGLLPTLRRSPLALLKASPRTYGWCRTRWRGATLALLLQVNRGLTVSAETMRRWLPEIGWVGKRAKRVARDDDPPRVNRLARSRWVFEPHEPSEAMVFADARDLHLWPHVGGAWRPQGTQVAVMTPGQHQQHSLAGGFESPGVMGYHRTTSHHGRPDGTILHGSARTTAAVRRAIQPRQERLAKLAKHDDVNPNTVATWQTRPQGHEAPRGPKPPRSTILTLEEEALMVACRQHPLWPWEDCLYAWPATRPPTARARHGLAACSGMASAS